MRRCCSRLDGALQIDIVCAADGAALPPGAALENYDGVTMTGSALNIYNGGAAVTRQIELVKAVFAAGVPFFGSCWGLQVAVTAAGGEVRANPRGREFGFARRVCLSDAGREHPLFAGKPIVFEAPTVHRDEIASLPAGAATLAVNDFGVQAASFNVGRGTFWGVQYHPEYDYRRHCRGGRALRRDLGQGRHVPRRSGARRVRRRPARAASRARGSDAALEARLGSGHEQRGTAAARNPQLAQRQRVAAHVTLPRRGHDAHTTRPGQSKSTAVVFPPQISTPTRSLRSGT